MGSQRSGAQLRVNHHHRLTESQTHFLWYLQNMVPVPAWSWNLCTSYSGTCTWIPAVESGGWGMGGTYRADIIDQKLTSLPKFLLRSCMAYWLQSSTLNDISRFCQCCLLSRWETDSWCFLFCSLPRALWSFIVFLPYCSLKIILLIIKASDVLLMIV